MAGKSVGRGAGIGAGKARGLTTMLYYNPKTRKAHGWVVTLPVVIPVALMAMVVLLGSQRMEKKMKEEERRAKIDVFDRF
jgi:hypothetical protein